VQIDLGVACWAIGYPPEDQLGLTLLAEELGFGTVWVAESYGADAPSVLGFLAGRTSRIGIGAAMLQMPARTPALTAMTAAALDVLSGGRLRLGLGRSGPVVAGWHGVEFDDTVGRTREYVEVVRKALSREPLVYEGKSFRLPAGGTRPLKLLTAPVQEHVPIYLGALGPRNVSLAAEVADGWMPMFLSPAHLANTFGDALGAGARRRSEALPPLDVNPHVQLAIDEDADRARDALRPYLALYLGGMGAKGANFYHRLVSSYGFGDVADAVQEHFLAGRRTAAAAALTPELIDAVSLAGPADAVARRLEEFRAAGIEHLTVSPAFGAESLDRREQLRAFAEIVR
jgi:F420-dependent oxidoreductase-like protein